MPYAIIFLLLALGAIGGAIAVWDAISWLAFLPGYLGFSFLLVSIAYVGVGPKLFGKRKSGRIAWWGWLLFGPYIFLNDTIFFFYRFNSREAASIEVLPNLWFGRRLSTSETRNRSWVGILDLASEFAANPAARNCQHYLSLPILDTMPPTIGDLIAAINWIDQVTASGPVYVHCALGHGRSACVIIGYLLYHRHVQTSSEGVTRLRQHRPGVKLYPGQKKVLDQLHSDLAKE